MQDSNETTRAFSFGSSIKKYSRILIKLRKATASKVKKAARKALFVFGKKKAPKENVESAQNTLSIDTANEASKQLIDKSSEKHTSNLSSHLSKPKSSSDLIDEAILQTTLALEDLDRRAEEAIKASQRTDAYSELLAEVLAYIGEVKSIVESSDKNTSDLVVPILLLHKMKETPLSSAKPLKEIEKKFYFEITFKNEPDTELSGNVSRYIMAKVLEPSPYIKYWLAKSPSLGNAYRELYNSVLKCLAVEDETSSRSKRNVLFFSKVMKLLKGQIIHKLSEIKPKTKFQLELEVYFPAPIYRKHLEKTKEVVDFLAKESVQEELNNGTSVVEEIKQSSCEVLPEKADEKPSFPLSKEDDLSTKTSVPASTDDLLPASTSVDSVSYANSSEEVFAPILLPEVGLTSTQEESISSTIE